ncbi:MAG: DUF3782 domain-containing protein [Spirochaetia bacterium]|nr:DUF3782 domain-containing protein [Spirochaetota bacterium]MDW8112282.1 DUF3782 domain-containing protein [Spirochaetia bacterium]
MNIHSIVMVSIIYHITETYLDEALAKLSANLGNEFYLALEKQIEEFDNKMLLLKKDFYEALKNQKEEIIREMDEKIEDATDRIMRQVDEKMDKTTEKLINRIDAIGERRGISSETAMRNFAESLVKEWGGTVKKWNKEVTYTGPGGVKVSKIYEMDIVITDGKEILVEVKSSCNIEAVEKFWEACEYYLATEKVRKGIDRIVVSFFAYEDVISFAKQEGIRIITN